MQYQELYRKYQDAISLRELSIDKNFVRLKEIFNNKIISSISLNVNESLVPFLAGIKDVFSFVDRETENIDQYKSELDRVFQENSGC